jgi:hypothetical protein
MASGYKHTPETDLDKTDRLPILPGTLVDSDVEDDAVPLDHTAVLPSTAFVSPQIVQPDFVRPSSVDLPSLAESVRSVEERIARQNAEFEALTRTYERARDAEAASAARANALAVDLAGARTALDAEQARSRELERISADRSSGLDAARSRAEESLRESERFHTESRTLRDALAARDATIAQVLHSLGERDAQLSALQQEHAKIVPALEATAKSTSQLETDLQAARVDANALGAELDAARQTVVALTSQLKRSDSEINATRYDLGAAKIQAGTYLDVLRTREWRRGFDQNLFRDLDAQVGAAQAGQGAVASERDRLQGELKALEARRAAEAATAETERTRMTAELAARDRTLAEAQERGSGDAQRVAQLLEAAQLKQAEQTTHIAQLRADQAEQIARLQSETEAREQEMAVLVAHLQEARRPIQSIEADVKRLTEELAAKSAAHAEFDEENRKLRAALERTRGALEEREFLIRRLEKSESNNANVLGRIQTSIERLGSVPLGSTAGAAAGATAERSAELIRLNGEGALTHVLSRRTRIGRAAGCELQIDSGSVSRHHALVLVGPRDTIIEDLNSTNGVLVNGRKVTRHVLSDGDAVTIGESQFRYVARPPNRASEPGATEPAPLE